MELPIAQTGASVGSGPAALIRAAGRARAVLSRTVAEEIGLDSGTVYVDANRPRVRLCNHATDVRLPAEDRDPVAAVQRLLEEFAQRNSVCHSLTASADRWPPSLGQAAQQAGFVPATRIVLRAERYAEPEGRTTHNGLQVIPARAAFDETRTVFRQMALSEHDADQTWADHLAEALTQTLDEPRLDLFLGRSSGQPVGLAGVLTLGHVGVIFPAYTVPQARGQGVGRTLLGHTMEHARRSLFEQVIVERGQGCGSIPLYTELGFAERTRYVQFRRPTDEVKPG